MMAKLPGKGMAAVEGSGQSQRDRPTAARDPQVTKLTARP